MRFANKATGFVTSIALAVVIMVAAVAAVQRVESGRGRAGAVGAGFLVRAHRMHAAMDRWRDDTQDSLLRGDPQRVDDAGDDRDEALKYLAMLRAEALDPEGRKLVEEVAANFSTEEGAFHSLVSKMRGPSGAGIASPDRIASVHPVSRILDHSLDLLDAHVETLVAEGQQDAALSSHFVKTIFYLIGGVALGLAGIIGVTQARTSVQEDRALRLLRESEERFRELVIGVKEYAIFGMNAQGIITTWNWGAERILGFSREEILGRHHCLFYPPEDAAAAEALLRVSAVEGTSQLEGWRVSKTARRFWARGTVSAVRDSYGNLRGFTAIIRDRTAEKAWEEKLESMKGRAEDAKQSMEEFLSVASHDLKSPLAVIQTQVHLLLQEGSTKGLERLDKSVRRMVNLVHYLLDVSRLTAGERVHVQQEKVDLGESVRGILDQWRPRLEESGNEIVLKADSLEGLWDPMRIEQMVSNLLDNAVKFGRGKPIEVTVEGDERWARVRVRDHGVGIPREKQEHVFDRFWRAEGEDRGRSFGLGLWIVRLLAEAHGGTVEVESEPGMGAAFTISLPRMPIHEVAHAELH